MNILALSATNSGVGYHRIIMPLTYMMQYKPNDSVLITNIIDEETLSRKHWDIVVMNRSVSFPAERMAKLREKYGFKLIVDNDDHWVLDPHHNLARHYYENKIAEQIISYIKIADICTVTHERLAAEVYNYNKNVFILPNAMPYGDGQFMPHKRESDRVRLFWSGSDTHAQDLSLLRGPMHRVWSDFDLRKKVKTVMAGYSEKSKPVWDVMASAFTNSLRFETTIYQMSMPDRYMAAYCDSDISLIPLLNTKFNSMKSNLKVLEAACKKNPAVVSMVDPYLDLPVCYVRTQQFWYRWVKELVNDKAMREEKGNELFDFCNKHFNINTINQKRYEIYSK